MNSLEGQVAVITGGGRGLGRAYAIDLARHGADVVINDVNLTSSGTPSSDQSPAEEVARAVESLGRRAVISHDSVATAEGAAAISRTAIDAFGRVDIVVCNAGFLRDKTVAKMSDDEWSSVIDVHLSGSFYLARAFWPELRERAGALILTTSHAGLLGHFGQANYSAAKSGNVGLARTLALEGERHGVRVNAVAPIATTRLSALADDELRQAVANFDPSYVARLVTSLALSDVSGAVLGVARGSFTRFVLHESRPVQFEGVPDAIDLASAIASLDDYTPSAPAMMPS